MFQTTQTFKLLKLFKLAGLAPLCDPDWIQTNDLLLSLPATAFAAPIGFGVWTITSPFQVCHV